MKNLIVSITIFVLIIETTQILGQNRKISSLTANKYALQNINAGIQSGNEGVRKNSIYLSGLYRLIETEEALINQLKTETIPNLKVVIALALFRMQSDKGMKELPNLFSNDNSSDVKRMSHAVYNEYLKTKYLWHQQMSDSSLV